jgi:hypothetical protein
LLLFFTTIAIVIVVVISGGIVGHHQPLSAFATPVNGCGGGGAIICPSTLASAAPLQSPTSPVPPNELFLLPPPTFEGMAKHIKRW